MPKFLETTNVEVPVFTETNLSMGFNVQSEHFAQLADSQTLTATMPNLIKVFIGDELDMMSSEHQLEISVPMVGLTDLLPNHSLHISELQFAAPVAINGWGAPEVPLDASYLYPEYILATDIVGNQYEVLIDEQGAIQLPAEGTGLFSMLSYLTFIYGDWQVKQGHGLTDVTKTGVEVGYLYFLPPSTNKSFEPKIALTHLDENHSKIVDTLRSIQVEFSHNSAIADISLSLTKENDHQVDVSLDFSNLSYLQSPMTIALNLEDLQNNAFSLFNPNSPIALSASQGWFHNTTTDSYMKPLGLSPETKTVIIRDLLSEYDMTKGLLQGDSLGISNENNYNDFLIYPEAIGAVYDQVADGLARNVISTDFLWQRVDSEADVSFDFSAMSLSAPDNLVLSELMPESENSQPGVVRALLEPIDFSEFQAHLSLFSEQPVLGMPNIQAQAFSRHDDAEQFELGSNFDYIMKQDVSLLDSDATDGLVLDINISENTDTGLQLSFEDVMDSPIQSQMTNGNSLAQNLSVLLNVGETSSSFSQDGYASSDVVYTEVSYQTTPITTELNFGFTQEPEV